MPSYHEIMTTDLSTLTTAAARWDGMAKKFHEQEVAYKRDVYGISLADGWQGLSANSAKARFDATLREFQYAQTEAKAIASLLRDAHTQYADLKGKLTEARAEAIKAGMKVSDQGVVTYDTEKLSDEQRTGLHDDPDYQRSVLKAIASWQARINQLVKDVGDADAGAKIALNAVVIDSNINDGTLLTGFNGQARGDIEKYEAEAAAAAKGARSKADGWVSEGKVELTGLGAGASVTTDPKYGKEGSAKAYADLFHATAKGTLTNGDWKLSGIADGYGGARATANYGFNNKGMVGKAEASAGARALAEGRAEYGPYAGVYGRGEGFAGVEVGVNAKATKDELTVGAKAFAGAKGTLAAGGEVAGIGVGTSGEGWAGPGGEAWWGYKKDADGDFHLGGKVGLSPILGGAMGFEVTVDPDKLSKTVGDAADAVGDGISSVKNTVTGLF